MAVHVIKDLKKLRPGLGNLFDVTWVNIGADHTFSGVGML